MFGSPRRRLEQELAALDAEIARHAMALVRGGATPTQLLDGLRPLTARSVELKDRIRRQTPWRRLEARRDELLRAMPAMPDGMARTRAEMELAQLDLQLMTRPRRKPMPLLALVLFTAAVVATVVMPPAWTGWLGP